MRTASPPFLHFLRIHISKMHTRTLISNATIVNEGRSFIGSVLIEDDHIETIAEGYNKISGFAADTVINASGCILLPGVIDEHVHLRDPGLTHKADITTESRAAAAGGITTFLDMPNTLPQTTSLKAFQEKLALMEQKSHVNYGCFFGATQDNLEEMLRLDRRKVCGIKLFMGASTGNMLVDNDLALDAIFEQTSMPQTGDKQKKVHGLPVMVHCEDSEIIARNMAACKEKYGCDPDIRFHSEIRSEEACLSSTRRAIALAKKHHTRLHVAHVSTASELKLFSKDTPYITAEACVPHLLFTNEDYHQLGARIKCNPAIKTIADRTALRKALTDGTISVIGTDHAPHTLQEKSGGAAKAVSGMPMLQFSLVSMLELVDERILSLERVVELMCHAPARLFNIENRGYLREGFKADLVLVRPQSPWTLTPNRIESRCNWSPLEGHTFRWRIEKTFCNGFLIYNKGGLTDENFRGLAVTYDR